MRPPCRSHTEFPREGSSVSVRGSCSFSVRQPTIECYSRQWLRWGMDRVGSTVVVLSPTFFIIACTHTSPLALVAFA